MSRIYAIDPGNTQTAFVGMIDDAPIIFDKVANQQMLDWIKHLCPTHIVIEMVACYGMPVGKEVFDTCVWIGRYQEAALSAGHTVSFLYRSEVKMNLCNSARAKDANVRQALIDRFAKHDLKNGKGTKKEPDWFYGFHADVWAAYAVGVTYMDRLKLQDAL
jgi:hypothetical protein